MTTGAVHLNKTTRPGGPCKCGCGEIVEQAPGSGRPRVWVAGHKNRKHPRPLVAPNCKCGCGQPTVRTHNKGPWPSYFPGHSPSAVKRPSSVRVP